MLTRVFLPNLRARLVAVIFLALLPAFALLVTVASLERTRAEENARLETMAIAQLTKSYYGEMISASEQMLAWLAQFPEVRGNDPVACNARLAELFPSLRDYLGINVTRPNGEVYCSAGPESLKLPYYTAQGQNLSRTLSTKRFSVGGFDFGPSSGQPNLTFGYPLLDGQGNVFAVVGAGLDLNAVGRRLSNSPFYDYTGILLMDSDGTVVLRHPDPEHFVGTNIRSHPLFAQAVRTKEGFVEMPGLSDVDRLWAITTIGPASDPDLYVLTGLTKEHIFAGVNWMLRSTMLGLGVIGVVALAAAWISAELMIVRRTQRVVDAVVRMGSGDFSARAGLPDDQSEVGQLAQTFDSMAEALEAREAENRRLLAEMQELNTSLETRVQERTEQLQISNSRLLDSQAELRRLSGELMRVTEQERARISREIHDQLGQLLTAVKIELRNLQKDLDAGRATAGDKVNEAVGLVDETIRSVRRISSDLRPGILDDFGLAAAVEWQLQEFANRTEIRWTFEAKLSEERLSRDAATAAFRICQEALTNVARHAEASEVSVTLSTEGENLVLTVSDNGRGLPEQSLRSPTLGLVGMRERARQLGGAIEIHSTDGQGTTVQCVLPLEPAPEAPVAPT